jgi:6-phosphofructokinase 1
VASFGFSTACNLGKDLVRNLMQDAATTQRWFFVTVMGRQTGHLALDIGGAAAATLTVIPEEFGARRLSLPALADLLEGAVLKRWVMGRPHGVAILSEGLAGVLEAPSLGPMELDPAGRPRLGEVELGRALKDHVSQSLAGRGLDVTIVAKDLGYELRCAPPGARDLQYARALGYWATRFLLDGGGGAMITIQEGRLVPMPLRDLLDPETGTIRVRRVDVRSEAYATLAAYMIRLEPDDLDDPAMCAALAREGRMPLGDVVSRLGRALRPAS